MSNQYGHAQIVKDGLTLCVDANAVSSYPGSGSTWYDISEYGNNLTNNGATFNSAGYFDFASARMEHWTSTAPGINSGAFTVCGWIYPDSFTSTNTYLGILNRSDGSVHVFSVFLTSSSGTSGGYGTVGSMAGWVYNASSSHVSYATTTDPCTPTLAEWNFCVWRFQDGVGMTFDLFNSSGHVTNTQSTPVYGSGNTLRTDTSNQFTIGGWRSNYYFDGKIAHVAQYFRNLSYAEISQNFNAQRSRFGV